FKKGDVVNILDTKQNKIGLGKVAFDSKEANSLIGQKDQQPIIHYNYLVLDSNS
ncbi:MAG: PUA domain-containing protein, partial [Flavicella sp.]